jgi:hypothetical protein
MNITPITDQDRAIDRTLTKITEEWGMDYSGPVRFTEMRRYVDQAVALHPVIPPWVMLANLKAFAELNFSGEHFEMPDGRHAVSNRHDDVITDALQYWLKVQLPTPEPLKPEGAEARDFVTQFIKTHLSDAEPIVVLKFIDEIKALKDPAKFPRQVVRYSPDKLNEGMEAVVTALRSVRDEQVYTRGGQLVWVADADTPGNLITRTKEIRAYVVESLRQIIMQAVDFRVWKGKAYHPDKCPDDLTRTLLIVGATGTSTREYFRPLRGLIAAPVLMPEEPAVYSPNGNLIKSHETGRLIQSPGYDYDTGLYATFEIGDFADVKGYPLAGPFDEEGYIEQERRTAELRNFDVEKSLPDLCEHNKKRHAEEHQRALADAKAAYERLQTRLLGGFNFGGPADCATAVAALMTAVNRSVCGPAPGFLITAPSVRAGKSTLAQTIGVVANGKHPEPMDNVESGEELDKRIMAVLQAGRTMLFLDNVKSGSVVNNTQMAMLLTQPNYSGRILGRTEFASFPTNITVVLTGNNVEVQGDMNSRILEIRLNLRPEGKATASLEGWAAQHRGEIVCDLLTIMKAYADCGHPEQPGDACRFSVWDSMIRRAVQWVSGIDINDKFKANDHVDPEGEQLETFLQAMAALFPLPVKAGEIAARLQSGSGFDPASDVFEKALGDISGGRRKAWPKESIGRVLVKFRGRKAGGLRLERTVDSKASPMWSVVQAEAAQ